MGRILKMGKMNFTKIFKSALPYILTLILVGTMTFVAEILCEGEIIFPEITALAIGYMVAQKQSWKVNDSRMIALITICAVVGVLIVVVVLALHVDDDLKRLHEGTLPRRKAKA